MNTHMDTKNSNALYILAHQMRVPLTRNKWVLSTLIDDSAGAYSTEQKELFQKMYADNDRAIAMVNDLLHSDELPDELGSNRIHTNISELVKKIVGEVQLDVARKHISLTHTQSEDIPSVLANVQNMHYVFENLLLNAIHYTPEGGSVSVTVEHMDQGVLVSVQDTGIGIPQAEQDKIFNKFFRASNAVMVDTAGSGLGLYIIKQIIEQHGGTIRFESVENQGSTFKVFLPGAKK
jgi:two-component system phosphate regulon sensor histidine kinase PhoR